MPIQNFIVFFSKQPYTKLYCFNDYIFQVNFGHELCGPCSV